MAMVKKMYFIPAKNMLGREIRNISALIVSLRLVKEARMSSENRSTPLTSFSFTLPGTLKKCSDVCMYVCMCLDKFLSPF